MPQPVSLFSRDFGGEGLLPPLILLHGLLGSSRNWQSAGGALSKKFRVYALDLRNHGRSPHTDEMSYEAMMADVLAWMDAHDLPRVCLLGHSMGGKVAMLLACQHPDRVERLIVVDIAPKDYTATAHRAEFAAMNALDLRALQSRAEAELRFEAFIGDWAMRKFLVTNLERADADNSWKWIINLPALTASLSELEANPLAHSDHYGGRTDFIIGEKSGYVKSADHPKIIQHFPQAHLTVITDSGHNPHMETRDSFVGAVFRAPDS